MKLFKLPSPNDLGWSKDNCLESELFKSNNNVKTWEDYDEKMKEEHSFLFWIHISVPKWISLNIKYPLLDNLIKLVNLHR